MSALCAGPFAVCPLSIGKWLKKKTDKPEVPQGELRTQVQSKITLQWCNEQFEMHDMMYAGKYIYHIQIYCIVIT